MRDRRPFDTPLLGQRGRPEDVVRDSLFNGTALSAPVAMLLTQAVATVRLAKGPSPVAARTLGVLGATMTCGYLIEREFPKAFSPAGLDPVVTPVAARPGSPWRRRWRGRGCARFDRPLIGPRLLPE